MNEEERQSVIDKMKREAREAEEQEWRLNFFDKNVLNAKVSFWFMLAGWCGFFLFEWLTDITDNSIIKFAQIIFFLATIFGTPVFLWHFIPVSVLKLPTKFQITGQVVGASIAAFLPLAVFIFVLSGPSFYAPPWVAEAKLGDFLLPGLFWLLLIYASRTFVEFPLMFGPPIRQIFRMRLYLVACVFAFIVSMGGDRVPPIMEFSTCTFFSHVTLELQ